MARKPSATAKTIDAISEGYRALNVVFMRDGVLDPEERYVLGKVHLASGSAHWADWRRRARNSYEDHGAVNGQLQRERRELVERFGEDFETA